MTSTVFRHPFTMIVSGSTGSGKTVWVMQLINNLNNVVENEERGGDIASILYCYGALNENVMELKRRETSSASLTLESSKKKEGRIKIITNNGLPTEERLREEARDRKLLLVLDDLMCSAKSAFLDTLFTLGSHNWGLSVSSL